jgi:hypothetical protein
MIDIDKLEPGAELDLLVGTKVMGCTVKPGRHKPHCFDLVIPGGVNSVDWVEEAGAWSGMPKYSTEIVAAWAVFRELSSLRTKKHYKPAPRLQFYEHDGIAIVEVPFVKFSYNSGEDGVGSQVNADALPDPYRHNMDVATCLAICRAAIKAVSQ